MQGEISNVIIGHQNYQRKGSYLVYKGKRESCCSRTSNFSPQWKVGLIRIFKTGNYACRRNIINS